jgi:hypothetical protein
MKQRGFIAIIFVIGCATGGVASQVVIPPVRAGTNPTRWEHICLTITNNLSTRMTEMGAQGWELVAVVPTYLDHKFDSSLEAQQFMFCSRRALP